MLIVYIGANRSPLVAAESLRSIVIIVVGREGLQSVRIPFSWFSIQLFRLVPNIYCCELFNSVAYLAELQLLNT